jgi:hypothetical protein
MYRTVIQNLTYGDLYVIAMAVFIAIAAAAWYSRRHR